MIGTPQKDQFPPHPQCAFQNGIALKCYIVSGGGAPSTEIGGNVEINLILKYGCGGSVKLYVK